jgi:hypothetical protein
MIRHSAGPFIYGHARSCAKSKKTVRTAAVLESMRLLPHHYGVDVRSRRAGPSWEHKIEHRADSDVVVQKGYQGPAPERLPTPTATIKEFTPMPALSVLSLALVRAALKRLNAEAKSGLMKAHVLLGAIKTLDEQLSGLPSLSRCTKAIAAETEKHPVRQATSVIQDVALLIGLAVDPAARRTWTEKRARQLKRMGVEVEK